MQPTVRFPTGAEEGIPVRAVPPKSGAAPATVSGEPSQMPLVMSREGGEGANPRARRPAVERKP